MSVWTLEIGEETKEVAEWQLTGLRLSTVNLGRDILTAERSAPFDGEPVAEFGGNVKLYRDGVKWFDGEVFVTPRAASGVSERQVYSFVGPWNFLERNVYKAPWFQASDGSLVYTSHLLFPLRTVAQHISDALTYAIARGANLQIGTITAPVMPPTFEVTDITIAGAILRLAHYAPDCVGWFDYATSPPTFHFKPRASLASVTLTMPTETLPFGSRLDAIEPIARHDLQVDNVHIIYETTSTEDGEEKMDFSIDVHPPGTTGLEDGCLSAIVNLQGFSATTVQGHVVAEQIAVDSLDFWKKVVPALNDSRIEDLALAGTAQRVGYDGEPSEDLPRMLIDGQLAGWMTTGGEPVRWQKEVITREFDFKTRVNSFHPIGPRQQPRQKYQAEITCTNVPAGETLFSTLATFEDGDPQPTGLAQFLFNALHPLQYDARFSQHKAECDGEVRMGNVVNLAGAAPDWLAMSALVQQVSCDIDRGVTEITCGPPRHLTIDQILDLLRVGRRRRRWTNPSTQEDGGMSARSVELGGATANNNAVPALPDFQRFVVVNNLKVIELNLVGAQERLFIDFEGHKTLTLDPLDPVWALVLPIEKRRLALREVCVRVNGVAMKMAVIGSLPYS